MTDQRPKTPRTSVILLFLYCPTTRGVALAFWFRRWALVIFLLSMSWDAKHAFYFLVFCQTQVYIRTLQGLPGAGSQVQQPASNLSWEGKNATSYSPFYLRLSFYFGGGKPLIIRAQGNSQASHHRLPHKSPFMYVNRLPRTAQKMRRQPWAEYSIIPSCSLHTSLPVRLNRLGVEVDDGSRRMTVALNSVHIWPFRFRSLNVTSPCFSG